MKQIRMFVLTVLAMLLLSSGVHAAGETVTETLCHVELAASVLCES